jgi:glycogen debranching enzyme
MNESAVPKRSRKRKGTLNSRRRSAGKNTEAEAEDRFSIVAASALADDRTRVLKQGETFAVFDHFGDIKPTGLGEEGLYHEGTRFLSTFALQLISGRPLFLNSTVQQDNSALVVNLTNPDIRGDGRILIANGILHFFKFKFLSEGVCHERLTVTNYGLHPVHLSFSIHFDADFSDIFEVRGARRPQRGHRLAPRVKANQAVLSYEGLDRVTRRTKLHFDPAPEHVSNHRARFEIHLKAGQSQAWEIAISCLTSKGPKPVVSHDAAWRKTTQARAAAHGRASEISTSSEQFNGWVNRSLSDVQMMVSETPDGFYPYAGVPWFSTAFGRDGIITALECLWCYPDLAAGVLRFLSATQAVSENRKQEAEPGKILHETRKGEMANLGEIPFGKYYGSVDATPLFVVLAGSYYVRTGDRGLISEIWPNIERALSWIDNYGDVDKDGFTEYQRQTPDGLAQQGWKDSHDSVFHADGTLAEGPTALCEVQGYVHAAKKFAAELALALGKPEDSRRLAAEAERIQKQFEESFWCDDLGTYALALDGKKRRCRVRASNPGHCLFSGIASPERAGRVAELLMSDDLFSGWGIRTLGTREARYNPMSYHNGSIWPHDNALIAAGLARYGLKREAMKVLNALFEASLFFELNRLPELFCGFPRLPGAGPTLYPVACSPQAWAAGAVFLMLQACLGMKPDAVRDVLRFEHPLLPEVLSRVRIRNLRIGSSEFSLILERRDGSAGVITEKRTGGAQLLILK